MDFPLSDMDSAAEWLCWQASDLNGLPVGFGSGYEFGQTALDKEIAAQAVAFVVKSSRKGIVSLCADVASLLRSRRSLEEKLLAKEGKVAQQQHGGTSCGGWTTTRSSSSASSAALSPSPRNTIIAGTELLEHPLGDRSAAAAAAAGCAHTCQEKERTEGSSSMGRPHEQCERGERPVLCRQLSVDSVGLPSLSGRSVPTGTGPRERQIGTGSSSSCDEGAVKKEADTVAEDDSGNCGIEKSSKRASFGSGSGLALQINETGPQPMCLGPLTNQADGGSLTQSTQPICKPNLTAKISSTSSLRSNQRNLSSLPIDRAFTFPCGCQTCEDRLSSVLKANEKLLRKLSAAHREMDALREMLAQLAATPASQVCDVSVPSGKVSPTSSRTLSSSPPSSATPPRGVPLARSWHVSSMATDVSTNTLMAAETDSATASGLKKPSEDCYRQSASRISPLVNSVLIDDAAQHVISGTVASCSRDKTKEQPPRAKLPRRRGGRHAVSESGSSSTLPRAASAGESSGGALGKLRKLIRGVGSGGGISAIRSDRTGIKDIQLNDEVSTKLNQRGLVRYIGPLENHSKHTNLYVGLELYEPVGTGCHALPDSEGFDGSIGGKKYFSCQKNHGIFVAMQDIVGVTSSKALHGELNASSDGGSARSEESYKSFSLVSGSEVSSSSSARATAAATLTVRISSSSKDAALRRHSQDIGGRIATLPLQRNWTMSLHKRRQSEDHVSSA